MNIKSLSVNNFYRAEVVDVAIEVPIVLFAGLNGAGKTSVLDAVRFALTGDPVRVAFKKDLGFAVNDAAGADHGSVTVTGDDWQASGVIPSGKMSATGISSLRIPFEASLAPRYFSSLTPDQRRAALFAMLGLKMDASAIVPKLAERGVPENLIREVTKLIGVVPMPELAKVCAEHATASKGAWHQVTGESWGEVKGASWLPTVPSAPHDSTPASVDRDIAATEADIDEYKNAIAVQSERSRAMMEREKDLAGLRQRAGMLQRRQMAYEATKKEFEETRTKLDDAKVRAQGGHAPKELVCTDCGTLLMMSPNGEELEPYRRPEKLADPAAALEVERLAIAFDTMTRALTNSERDLNEARRDATALAELESIKLEPPADTAEIKAALEDAQDRLRTMKTQRDLHRQHAEAKANADKSRTEAAALHANIIGWTAFAKAIGPSGIPAEVLNGALGEVNGRLELTSRLAQWDRVSIREDMEIMVGPRPYRTASTSAQWRADALLAEMCSFWGSRIMALDGIDVLDSIGRRQLVLMLHSLAMSGQIGTCLMTGTFAVAPSGLPATVKVYWMERGRIAEQKKDVAA